MGEIPLSELARRCATEFSTKELCRLTDAQHQEYLRLLSALKTLNASHASDTKKRRNSGGVSLVFAKNFWKYF